MAALHKPTSLGLLTVNDGLRLGGLLLLFPQRLGGFKLVHLRGEHHKNRRVRRPPDPHKRGSPRARPQKPGLFKKTNKKTDLGVISLADGWDHS